MQLLSGEEQQQSAFCAVHPQQQLFGYHQPFVFMTPPDEQQQQQPSSTIPILSQLNSQCLAIQYPSFSVVGFPFMAPIIETPQLLFYATQPVVASSLPESSLLPPVKAPQPQNTSAGGRHRNPTFSAFGGAPNFQATAGHIKSSLSTNTTATRQKKRVASRTCALSRSPENTTSLSSLPAATGAILHFSSDERPVCRHYVEGKCDRKQCRFSHDVNAHPATLSDAPLREPDADPTASREMTSHDQNVDAVFVATDLDEDVLCLTQASST